MSKISLKQKFDIIFVDPPFAKNEFKPECCVPPFSGVSSADGCACVTKEQVDYINMRGGNRSSSSIYWVLILI